MEKKGACEILLFQLEEMKASRKLNESAIPTLQKAIAENKSREKYWLSNKEIPQQTAFVMYHASRNNRIILEKMHSRFIGAAEKHENPRVVDDAMLVYPELQEMCIFMDTLKKAEISESLLEFVRKRTRNLRNTAEQAQMFPSFAEEAEKVNKKELAKQFNDIAEDLRLNLV
jgi:hypothetical protein